MKEERPLKRWRHNCCSIEWYQNPDGKGIRLHMKDCTGIRDHFPSCRAMALLTWNLFKEKAPPVGQRAPVTQKVFDALTVLDLDCPFENRDDLVMLAGIAHTALVVLTSSGKDLSVTAVIRKVNEIKKGFVFTKQQISWILNQTTLQAIVWVSKLPPKESVMVTSE